MNNEEIISFQHDEEWAITKFNNYIKRKVFKSKKFFDELQIEKIRKVYAPFYKFETNNSIHAFIDFTSHDSGYYYYERIIEAQLENIISGGKNLNDNYISNILPYNLNKLVNINTINIDCEKITDINDISIVKENNVNDISEKMKKITIKSCPVFLSDYHTITSKCKTDYLSEKTIYLPLWIIEAKTHDSTYKFYLNDQTGKIAGNIPVNQFNNYKLFTKICIGISLLFILLTFLSIKFKMDIIFYPIVIAFSLFVLFFIYIGITCRYSLKYKFSNAKIIHKKYLKKKRYWFTELYQKARNEFEKEIDVN